MEVKIGLERNLSKSRAEIAGKNFIKNSRFSGNINGWSESGVVAASAIDDGVGITGAGYLYQKLNSDDVQVGIDYQLSIFVNSIATGVAAVNIGTTATGTETATQTLIAGWNLINFTAGATCYVSFTGSAAGTIISLKEVKVQEETDFKVTGSMYSGASHIGQNWRTVENSNGDLEFQKLVDGVWTTANIISVQEEE